FALLGLDQLQVGQALSAGGLLVLQRLHGQRYLELGHVADKTQALRVAGSVAGADVDAALSRKVRHGQSPLREVVLGLLSASGGAGWATPCSMSQRAVASSSSRWVPGE